MGSGRAVRCVVPKKGKRGRKSTTRKKGYRLGGPTVGRASTLQTGLVGTASVVRSPAGQTETQPCCSGTWLGLLHGVVDVDLKLGARLEVGGWLPVSLTELGHWHGFNALTDDGAVSIRRRRKENKRRENSVGAPK